MRQVKVYWNIRRKCWSVLDARTRRVIRHDTHLVLRDASFSVSERGRQRVLESRTKSVHAFATGTPEPGAQRIPDNARHVFYNPFRTDLFRFVDSGEPVSVVDVAYFAEDGKVFVCSTRTTSQASSTPMAQ